MVPPLDVDRYTRRERDWCHHVHDYEKEIRQIVGPDVHGWNSDYCSFYCLDEPIEEA